MTRLIYCGHEPKPKMAVESFDTYVNLEALSELRWAKMCNVLCTSRTLFMRSRNFAWNLVTSSWQPQWLGWWKGKSTCLLLSFRKNKLKGMSMAGISWAKRFMLGQKEEGFRKRCCFGSFFRGGDEGKLLKIVKYDRPGLAFVTITLLSSAFKIYYITLKSLGVITILPFI